MKIELNLIVFALFCAACGNPPSSTTTVNYPSPAPDTMALVYLPGIVSRDSLDFNAAFSTDGKTFYFSRSKPGKYLIMESNYINGGWSVPVVSPLFDTAFSNTDPFITENNDIYFISNRPAHAKDTIDDYDIYRMEWKDGKFTAPEQPAGINSDSIEYYVSVAKNGNIYFGSYRDGNLDLYYSVKNESGYGKPVNLGSLINSPADEHDPLIAPDEDFLIYTSSRPGGAGEADLYISFRDGNGWKAPTNMGSRINTATYEYCPNLSPDGRFFFFSSEMDVKWISAGVLERYR